MKKLIFILIFLLPILLFSCSSNNEAELKLQLEIAERQNQELINKAKLEVEIRAKEEAESKLAVETIAKEKAEAKDDKYELVRKAIDETVIEKGICISMDTLLKVR